MGKKHVVINIVANVLSSVIGAAINLFLARYVVNSLGSEAYGFVGLSGNFVTYAAIVTGALNAMASRFISLKIFEDDMDDANKYFSSVVIANLVMSVALLIPAGAVTSFIDKLVNISPTLVLDVKWLFGLMFLNFLLSVSINVFSVAIFVKNKLYLNSLRQMETQILRFLIIFVCFVLLPPRVWYWGAAAIVCTLYVAVFNILYWKKFIPDLRVQKSAFNIKAVQELISSGVWNSFVQLTTVLMEGLDLLIANLFIGGAAMGVLAIAKVMPVYFAQLNSMISPAFEPGLFKLFAEKKSVEFVDYVKRCNRILGFIMAIAIADFFVFGKEIFVLWVPRENAELLWVLSSLAASAILIGGFTRVLYDVYIVTNKLRLSAIVAFFLSVVNLGVVFILLKTTNMGLYAIAGTSSVLSLLRLLLFNPIYAAKCLNISWSTFYLDIMRGLISCVILVATGIMVKIKLSADTWLSLAAGMLVLTAIGFVVNAFVILSKDERNMIAMMVKSRVKRVG